MVAVILISGTLGFLAGLRAALAGDGFPAVMLSYATTSAGAMIVLTLTGAVLCRRRAARPTLDTTFAIATSAEPAQK